MTRAVLVVRDEKGEPRSAVRSIFPAHETDLQAITFNTTEEAEQFALISASSGAPRPRWKS